MGSAQSSPASSPSVPPAPLPAAQTPAVNPLNPKGLKPCCACPETKSARDDCFLKNDPSVANEKCKELVQAHIACMKSYGFDV